MTSLRDWTSGLPGSNNQQYFARALFDPARNAKVKNIVDQYSLPNIRRTIMSVRDRSTLLYSKVVRRMQHGTHSSTNLIE
jgi:hypothetical protein